jgi:hypothetical protein
VFGSSFVVDAFFQLMFWSSFVADAFLFFCHNKNSKPIHSQVKLARARESIFALRSREIEKRRAFVGWGFFEFGRDFQTTGIISSEKPHFVVPWIYTHFARTRFRRRTYHGFPHAWPEAEEDQEGSAGKQ